jgi:tricarballylate dehydrogenase
MGIPLEARREFDVIVVGGGNAALCAALSANEWGARVVILEAATREERGGNSRFAGCIFRACHDGLDHVKPLLCNNGQADSDRCTMKGYTPEDFRADMESTSHGRNDAEQTELVIKQGFDTLLWMRDQGVKWELLLHKYFDTKAVKGIIDLQPGGPVKAVNEGVGLTDDLWAAVERTDIDVRYDTPAHDLLTEGDTIRGVQTRQRDSYVNFEGQVVLACGGFEANPAMRRQYLGEGWDLVVVRGTRFNTGTMLQRSLAAGAQACGHWGGCHASPQDISSPLTGNLEKTKIAPRYSYPYGIMVNMDGQRFVDEGEDHFGMTYAKTGSVIRLQPQGTAFQIFDQQTLHLLEPRYATVEPVKDDTLEGLAKKLGLSPAAFTRTVTTFNDATQPGQFDAFHNDGLSTDASLEIPKSNWALPIDQPPFVAYTVTCGITFTYGGIKVDTNARVLNNEGKHMPGLWAAGEMTGGLFYHNYAGGAGLTKGAIFGRIAGREAAQRAKSVAGNGK